MRLQRLVFLVPAALLLAGSGAALAQADWVKSYPVSGKASLTLSTGDAAVEIRSCGSCRGLRVRVEWHNSNPGDFELRESQNGNSINFMLREKARILFSFFSRRSPLVTVDAPAALDLEARTSDGAIRVSGVQGYLKLHTTDGKVDVEDAGGALHLEASDGTIHVHNLKGSVDSSSSDGRVAIDGRLTAFHIHTGDGSLELALDEGSKLDGSSRIQSSDGSVALRVPRSLAADLDVHASDGEIECALPVSIEGYSTAHQSGHNLRGHLNGGGPPLSIDTSDGSVSITAFD